MIRLSSRELTSAHKFLLEINGSTDADDLRTRIPAGLSRLIACEHASFNELDHSGAPQRVVPTPVPAWWPRLGEAYQTHLLDHPLLNRTQAATVNRTLSLGDLGFADAWKRSALNHEYFVPLGVRHQLSAAISRSGGTMVGIAVNRARREFASRDRALLDLLNPHIAQAWRNAQSIAALRGQLAEAQAGSVGAQAVVAVDRDQTRLRPLTPTASRILRKYFGADAEGEARLPEQLGRWLRSQRNRAASPDAFRAPSAAWVIAGRGGHLTVQLARTRPEETVLLLTEASRPAPEPGVELPGLTPRESEILDWISEGKRSPEIAVILGISPRTVEKHIEHIFLKLGVETRSAAVRQGLERR